MVLDMSLREYRASNGYPKPMAGPSTTNGAKRPSYLQKRELNGRLSSIESEIADVENNIAQLQTLRASLIADRQQVLNELEKLDSHTRPFSSNAGSSKGKDRQQSDLIDYKEQFEWTPLLMATMKRVFNINNFRLCQEA